MDAKDGSNYIGYLKNTPGSSVAVTGDIVQPEDRMDITLLSQNNKDQMFEVDYFGRTKVIPIPKENEEEKKHSLALARTKGKDEEGDLDLEEGDQVVDEEKKRLSIRLELYPCHPSLKWL